MINLEHSIKFYEKHFSKEQLEEIKKEAIKITDIEPPKAYVTCLIESYKKLLGDNYNRK